MINQKINNPIKRFQIIGLNQYRDFEINFENPCKIIVGENGLGKTTIMNVFYYVLTTRWTNLDKIQFDFIELELVDKLIEFSQSELRMYVSYLINDGGFIDDDAILKFKYINDVLRSTVAKNVVYFPVFRNLDQVLVELFDTTTYEFIGKRKSIDVYTKEFVLDNLVFSAKKVQQTLDRYKQTPILIHFKKLCNKYLVETRFDENHNDNSFVINKNNNEQVAIKDLSSGEKQIINFFARTYLCNEPDLIVLIDEPEISLSINWQKSLLPDIIHSNNCRLLFAITHSPFTFKNELESFAVPMKLYTKQL